MQNIACKRLQIQTVMIFVNIVEVCYDIYFF